jgi:hypothetical protein
MKVERMAFGVVFVRVDQHCHRGRELMTLGVFILRDPDPNHLLRIAELLDPGLVI